MGDDEERAARPLADRSWWKNYRIVAAIIGALGAVVAAFITVNPWDGGEGPTPGPEGEILAPRAGTRVAPRFTAEGRLSSIPEDAHVWLAVQRGNELFPKEPEIPRDDDAWVHEFVEAGEGDGDFSLVLLLVDATGQESIEAWLEQGRHGGFPGMSSITGARRLDVVSGLAVTTTSTTTTTSTSTTTTTTTTTEPSPPSFPLEMEDASGDGEVMHRSNASGGSTLLLRDGESATVAFTVSSSASFRLVVRYSNDNAGALEHVTVSVDGRTLGEFGAKDTGDNGYGWNVFADSPVLGPRDLVGGNHALTVSVVRGDGYGVEIDLVSPV